MHKIDPDAEEFLTEYIPPEIDLMTHVLYAAIKDCFHHQAEHRRSAHAWFKNRLPLNTPEREWMTFDNVCKELRLTSQTRTAILGFVGNASNARVFIRLVGFGGAA